MVQTSPRKEAPPAAAQAGAADPGRAEPDRAALLGEAPTRWPRPKLSSARAAALVLAVGLAATGILSWLVSEANARNEARLLAVQVREAGTVIAQIASTVQTPLASGAEIANVTGGDLATFRRFMVPFVGPGKPFVSASLWRVSGGAPRVLTTVGSPSELAARPVEAARFLRRAQRAPALAVAPLLTGHPDRLGYAYTAGGAELYAAYAESAIPPDRRAVVPESAVFTGLDFALYLGPRPVPSALLEATQIPLTGATATTTTAFGDSRLTLVGAASSPLGGALSNSLQWIVAGAGILLTLVGAGVAHHLVRRRAGAEVLAQENRHLYRQQRSIAETLQRSLLPEALPAIPGMELAVRYVPGTSQVDVGGDWYDVIELPEGFLFVVGDVSGRGLRAATKMAALHYAIRAYAAEGHPPEAIVGRLGELVNLERDGHFATVLCGHAQVARRQISLVDAGHLAPLVVADGRAYYPPVSVGVPVGVQAPAGADPGYRTARFEVPAGATVLAFTDGLVERRNEALDRGLERLRTVALAQAGPLEEVLDGVLDELVGEDVSDDTALLGLRWLR